MRRDATLVKVAIAVLGSAPCRNSGSPTPPGCSGVSDDTVRRWVDAGTLPVQPDASNRKVIDGAALAAFAREQRPRRARPVGRAELGPQPVRRAGHVGGHRQGDGPGRDAVRSAPRRVVDVHRGGPRARAGTRRAGGRGDQVDDTSSWKPPEEAHESPRPGRRRRRSGAAARRMRRWIRGQLGERVVVGRARGPHADGVRRRVAPGDLHRARQAVRDRRTPVSRSRSTSAPRPTSPSRSSTAARRTSSPRPATPP